MNVRLPDTERTRLPMQNQFTTPPQFGELRLPGRFWAKVRVLENGCWEWQATKSHGYGKFKWQGEMSKAHRVACTVLVGPIPRDLEPDHLCDNPSCVYPAHIQIVTHRINALRSNGLTAQLARRTHCKRGHHALSGENLYITPQGGRRCRQCQRDRQRVKP